MQTERKLRVGHIRYLNCVPFFQYLVENGFVGELVSGVPSELNHLLQSKQLDVSPSSSFEYARNWRDYLLLPGHSIAANGPVHSVLLFSPRPLAELAGEQIAITGESATSINLLRVLLREYYGHEKVHDAVPPGSVEELIAAGKPALLIGNRALRQARNCPVGTRNFDLGELWHWHTGLPFVFALWMIRRDAVTRFNADLSKLSGQLTASVAKVLADPLPLARPLAPQTGLLETDVVEYWRSIDYRLEPLHLEGLQLFFSLCAKYDLLQAEPPLHFFDAAAATEQISG